MNNDWNRDEKYVKESLDSIKTRLLKVEERLTNHEVSAVKMESRIMTSISDSEARIMKHITKQMSGYDKLEAKFYAYSGMLSLFMASGVGAAFKYLLD